MDLPHEPLTEPPADEVIDERYVLTNPTEIHGLMRSMVQNRSVLTGYFGGSSVLVSLVLRIEPERNLLILDYGPSDKVNEAALRAPRIVFHGVHQQIKVRFQAGPLGQVRYEGDLAFRTSIPRNVYYPQRREYFRLSLPSGAPLHCTVKGPFGSNLKLKVVDISVGGIGVVESDSLMFDSRAVFLGCEMELPEHGVVLFDMEVRTVFDVLTKNGKQVHRAGCMFVNLKPSAYRAIQRFILNQQAEMRKLHPD